MIKQHIDINPSEQKLKEKLEMRVSRLNGLSLFTKKPIKQGETIFVMEGDVLDHPTQTSVQIGHDEHIEDNNARYLNHNCHPTARVDQKKHALIAARDLKEGDEINFDYRTNETKMAVPFKCHCCNQMICGKTAQKETKPKMSRSRP